MPSNDPLPLELPTARVARARRASAGERRSRKRVTSFGMQPQDELLLDALRSAYGTNLTGEAIRLALRDAADKRGIDVNALGQETAAA